ncbi:MAG: LuxR C-terminal-related transcriptional regulator [Gammaproteobacteria bacterium]
MSNIADLLFRAVDGVFAVDAKHKLIFWNPGCAQLFGISASEALGRPCSKVVRGKDPTGQPFCGGGCCVSRLTRGENVPGTFPLRVHNSDGGTLRLSVSIVLVPSRSKERWTCVHLLRRGEAVDPIDMLEYESLQKSACKHNPDKNDNTTLSLLTAREQEILQLLAEGLNVAVMSKLLNIARVTVRNHLQHIQAKLGVHSQVETVAYAYRHNLIHY